MGKLFASLTSIFFTTLLTTVLAAQEPVIVRSYDLNAEFYPEKASIKGWAGVYFQNLPPSRRDVTFYLHGELYVDSIKQEDQNLSYDYSRIYYEFDYSAIAAKTTVTSVIDPTQTLDVFYHGYLNPSRATANSNYMRVDNSGVYLRSYGYSLWFPIFLEPRQQSYEVDFNNVSITVPAKFNSIFVGNKIDEFIDGDRRITKWQAGATDLFEVQCSARPWKIINEGNIYIYHMPDEKSESMARKILKYARFLIDRYSSYYNSDVRVGQNYIMQMPEFGDISSGNVTGIADKSWLEFDQDIQSKRLLAHELVHPFVQVPILRDDPLYAMVIEGFPSYFDLPVLEQELGKEWYDAKVDSYERAYLYKRENGKHPRGWSIPAEKPIIEITADDIGDYKDRFVLNDRVVLFWDYIRSVLGDDEFYKMAGDIFSKPKLNLESFKLILARYLPDNVDDIHVWLETTEFPEKFRLANRGK